MSIDAKSQSSFLDLSSNALTIPTDSGSLLRANRSELVSKLFEMTADLETVLERKRHKLHLDINQFIDEVHSLKKGITFNAHTISTPVQRDQRVEGLLSFLLGILGYERREKKTHFVLSKQLDMQDIHNQIQKFIKEAQTIFEQKFLNLVDIESVIQECLRLASQELKHDEYAVLKVTIRRAFSKISIKPWQIHFSNPGSSMVLVDVTEITEAAESAKKTLSRIADSIVAKANSARKKFDTDVKAVLSNLGEDIIKACLDRQNMEELLNIALQKKVATFDGKHLNFGRFGEPIRVVQPTSAEGLEIQNLSSNSKTEK